VSTPTKPEIGNARVIYRGKANAAGKMKWTIVLGKGVKIPTRALFTVVKSPIMKQQNAKNIALGAVKAKALAVQFRGATYKEGVAIPGNLWRSKNIRIIVNF